MSTHPTFQNFDPSTIQRTLEQVQLLPGVVSLWEPRPLSTDSGTRTRLFQEFVEAVSFSGDLPPDQWIPFQCEWAAKYYLLLCGVFYVGDLYCRNTNCPRFEHSSALPMKFNFLCGGWRCRHCSTRRTLLANTIFSERNIKPHLILRAFYFFLHNVPYGLIAAILSISEKSTYLLMDDFKQLLLEDAEIVCSGKFLYFFLKIFYLKKINNLLNIKCFFR